jgi:hypothetical protein
VALPVETAPWSDFAQLSVVIIDFENVYSSSLTCSTVVQVTWYQVTRSRDPFGIILGVLLRNRRFRKIRPSGAFLREDYESVTIGC